MGCQVDNNEDDVFKHLSTEIEELKNENIFLTKELTNLQKLKGCKDSELKLNRDLIISREKISKLVKENEILHKITQLSKNGKIEGLVVSLLGRN